MGSDDAESVMGKKSRRKLDKKVNKYKHFISQLPGIHHSSEPTKFLMICNAGLVNGFDEGQAVQIFSKYGRLVSVSMLPGKSFCFAAFSEAADAQNAYESLNGKMKLPKMLGPIYMIYTTSAPSSKMEYLSKKPNGLFVLENFVTEKEEMELLNSISFSETTHSGNPALLKNRRVKHYGYEFQYSNNNVNKEEKLPEDLPNECNILKGKLEKHGWGHLRWPPDQLTVNEYQPGQGIPPHIDTHSAFESPIMSLSLQSDIVMEFRHADGTHFPLHLPRRSLLIMDEEARYDWTHTIKPRKTDVIYENESGAPLVIERGVRLSFTFRWLREGSCKCIYRDQCDSQAEKPSADALSSCDASRLESQHVHQVYNKISSHFSQTRYRAWPNVAEFVASLPSGSVLFDVGCGNGKYFGLNRNIFELGGDRSDGLLGECSKRGFEAVQCDCLQLPLRSESVDGLICIAVIHHLSTHERRVEAIREMARVLRKGGRGLVYVWAKDQQRNNVPSKYLKQEEESKSGADGEDVRKMGNCERRGRGCSKIELDQGEGVNISCKQECRGKKGSELVRENVDSINISCNEDCTETKVSDLESVQEKVESNNIRCNSGVEGLERELVQGKVESINISCNKDSRVMRSCNKYIRERKGSELVPSSVECVSVCDEGENCVRKSLEHESDEENVKGNRSCGNENKERKDLENELNEEDGGNICCNREFSENRGSELELVQEKVESINFSCSNKDSRYRRGPKSGPESFESISVCDEGENSERKSWKHELDEEFVKDIKRIDSGNKEIKYLKNELNEEHVGSICCESKETLKTSVDEAAKNVRSYVGFKHELDKEDVKYKKGCDRGNTESKGLENELDVESICFDINETLNTVHVDARNVISCVKKVVGRKSLELDQEGVRHIGICNEATRREKCLQSELDQKNVQGIGVNLESVGENRERVATRTKLDEESGTNGGCNSQNSELKSANHKSDQDISSISGCNIENSGKLSLNRGLFQETVGGSSCGEGYKQKISSNLCLNRELFQETVGDFSCGEGRSGKISSNLCTTNIDSCNEDEGCENIRKTSGIINNCSLESEFSLPVHNNRTQFKHDDILVPWTFKTETFYRYYHVFKEGELECLCSFVPEIQVEKIYYDQGNWCVIFKKCSE